MENRKDDWKEQQQQTGASDESKEESKEKKGGIHNNALYAASMGRAATAQVNPHDNSGLAQTGTNVSYEGPTAPGGGGSAGTGYGSGQSATGSTTITTEDYDKGGTTRKKEENTDDGHVET